MNHDKTGSAYSLNEDREKVTTEAYEAAAGLYAGEVVVSQEVLEQWNQMPLEEKVKFEKQLVWKLDLRLVPWLSLLYLLSFLDRTNIGNAKLQGVSSLEFWLTEIS
jgi:hypothetical protein